MSARRGGRRRIVLLLVSLLLVGAAVVTLPVVSLLARVERVGGALTSPPVTSDGTLDVVLLGVDGPRGAGTPWLDGRPTPASLMVVSLEGPRREARVLGIPLDTVVAVPGHGTLPVGEVAALPTPDLLVGAVEEVTGERMDHLAAVDWSVFESLTGRAGGLELELADADRTRFPLNARGYVYVDGAGSRTVFAWGAGDDAEDVLQRQLVLMQAVVSESLRGELHKEPWEVYRLLDAVADGLAVDDGWSALEMAGLLRPLWSLRSADISYEVLTPASR